MKQASSIWSKTMAFKTIGFFAYDLIDHGWLIGPIVNIWIENLNIYRSDKFYFHCL